MKHWIADNWNWRRTRLWKETLFVLGAAQKDILRGIAANACTNSREIRTPRRGEPIVRGAIYQGYGKVNNIRNHPCYSRWGLQSGGSNQWSTNVIPIRH